METTLPTIATSDPGSFARRTIVERKPKIIAQVLEANRLAPSETAAVDALGREMQEGTLANPLDGPGVPRGALTADERGAWMREIVPHRGKSWLDLPWYFAEAFFYLKILAACGWFAGPRAGVDPFAPLKERELRGPQGGLESAPRLLESRAGLPEADALRAALMSSLWGNRVDLSNFEIDEGNRRTIFARERELLVVDDTDAAVPALGAARALHIVLDNAGPELVSDLLLTARKVQQGAAVVLHAKRMPFFVSDATAADVNLTIRALAGHADTAVAAAGAVLANGLRQGRLRVEDHWFWSSPLFFPEMPADLRAVLSHADLVLVKGDANYRRLLSDRKWETWRSMEEIASSFPRPFLCLRTMKSEIVVDVPGERAAALRVADPEWLINGRRGIIRLCHPAGAASHPRAHPAP